MEQEDIQIEYNSPCLTPLKQNNLQYHPSEEEILSYAQQVLEINPIQDTELIYLAEQALKASLPENWEACQYYQANNNDQEAEPLIVYRNRKTKQVVFDHPLDQVYRQKARQLKLMKNTAKYSQNITPISEQLLQSSVIMFKNNSGKNAGQQSLSIQNNSSSRIKNSMIKGNDILHKNKQIDKKQTQKDQNSKKNKPKKQFQKNKTQQSLDYAQDELFDNFSLITQNEEELDDSWKIENINIEKVKRQGINRINNENNKGKVSSIKLKQKPKVLKPKHQFSLINKNNQKKRQNYVQIIGQNKMKYKKQQRRAQVKQKKQKISLTLQQKRLLLRHIIEQKLSKIHKQSVQKMSDKIKKQLTIQQIEQRIIQMKYETNNLIGNDNIGQQNNKNLKNARLNSINQNTIKRLEELHDKQKKLKKLQTDSKVIQNKIQNAIQLLEIQNKVLN